MENRFGAILGRFVECINGKAPVSGFDVSDQFRPGEGKDGEVARNLNAAFLIALCGAGHPLYEQARGYLGTMGGQGRWSGVAAFFMDGIDRVDREVRRAYQEDGEFRDALDDTALWGLRPGMSEGRHDALRKVWGIFFPEGAWCLGDHETRIDELRKRRRVMITKLNPHPVTDPPREILFLSNLLVTIPHEGEPIDSLPYRAGILRELKGIVGERQRFWFDHPIQIGVRNEENEAIYGLRGLEDAMAVEKSRGTMGADDRLTCLLSVSVTHDGLHRIVRDYLKEVYSGIEPLSNLDVYLFSEVDTERIVGDLILPGAERYLGVSRVDSVRKVFGVDGEYGRHYSFLKALSAFWQVFVDPGVKGSFKIDMDQVFDQEALIRETGRSALEHFLTPLWGAMGSDTDGRPVELGMMAGALVNEADIGRGLFTPDVPIPPEIPGGEAVVFYSPLPMGISTRAEMMTRYGTPPLDGVKACVQRIHVTGGTCAALISSIRGHRPFTPTFVGRAEDQAYLLSSMFRFADGNLRYLHKPGLIMRHDKEAFAGQAIRGARLGKYVGDLVRILIFTYYARGLPWSLSEIKRLVDPFTGCFVSKIPFTLVYLRLALRLMEVFSSKERGNEGLRLLNLAVDRLKGLMDDLDSRPDLLRAGYEEEKEGWEIFYDVLDRVEEALSKGDAFAVRLRRRAREFIKDCRVPVGQGQGIPRE